MSTQGILGDFGRPFFLCANFYRMYTEQLWCLEDCSNKKGANLTERAFFSSGVSATQCLGGQPEQAGRQAYGGWQGQDPGQQDGSDSTALQAAFVRDHGAGHA